MIHTTQQKQHKIDCFLLYISNLQRVIKSHAVGGLSSYNAIKKASQQYQLSPSSNTLATLVEICATNVDVLKSHADNPFTLHQIDILQEWCREITQLIGDH